MDLSFEATFKQMRKEKIFHESKNNEKEDHINFELFKGIYYEKDI